MTKSEKLASLKDAMKVSKRQMEGVSNGESFYHFTDSAPEELKEIYLSNYEVRDIDYETFSMAIDFIADKYADAPEESHDGMEIVIFERDEEFASVYTGMRLSYLNVWNQDEISAMVKENDCTIEAACALWYDKQVETAALLINDWVNAKRV